MGRGEPRSHRPEGAKPWCAGRAPVMRPSCIWHGGVDNALLRPWEAA
jgi:hypothetical protein